MSQVTPAPVPHTLGWTKQPEHEHATDSSFDFDHPTPVDSTDGNIFHTPEIEDLLWQENYKESGSWNLDHNIVDQQNDLDQSPGIPYHSVGSASHQNSLPSPQSTDHSTPEPSSSHSKKTSQNSTIATSLMCTPQRSLRKPSDSPNTNRAMLQHSDDRLFTPVQSSFHVVSPRIEISKHSRGDSPARSDLEVPRVSKKRSASNLSQSEYFTAIDSDTYISHLMPPDRDIQGEWEGEEDHHERTGLGPPQRDAQEVSSFDDIQQQQEHDKTVTEVQYWLENTALDPAAAAQRSRGQDNPDRIRSRSTGTRPYPGQQPILRSLQCPGPGLMIDEQSEYYYSSDTGTEHSLSPEDHPETLPVDMPQRKDSEVAPDEIEPLPRQFFRPRHWQDPVPTQLPGNETRYQPDSSNAAMHKFALRAKDTETASRAATWGTGRRRLSEGDGDAESVTGGMKTRHLSLTKTKVRERGISIVKEVRAKAKEQYLKRSNSRGKNVQMQAHPELEQVQSPEPIDERSSTEFPKLSFGSPLSKSKSPSITAALREATGSLAAVGVGSAGLNLDTEEHPEQHESLFRRTIRHVRSRSDVNRSPRSPGGVTTLVAQQLGGMPVPFLASPSGENIAHMHQQSTPIAASPDLRIQAQTPIKMPLSPQPANVMPNFEGFKIQIQELNPNLASYLVDRIAHDQVRRYKRLVKNRVDHIAAVADNNCASLHLCPATGGEAEILPSRLNGRDTANSSSRFKVTPGVDSDNEDATFDGIVSPAAFPNGIPLPPTKRLPARFECPLCFQVKSFQKPSDWTKHVHEDVQPFTCTFFGCQEPRSFKRKADWVRHENERHRHPEWWKCNISECAHQCFRKDNFVQHLVREHKRKEPKVKGRSQNSKGKCRSVVFSQEEQEFWNLVDACRHEQTTDAKSEPCKFCGNICASWKKLGVHVGKHMEQIAMPVLELVEKRNVTKDTIISPVEPLQRSTSVWGTEHNTTDFDNGLSPYTQSAISNYQSSSAGHSPAVGQAVLGVAPTHQFLGPGYNAAGGQQGPVTSSPSYARGLIAGYSGVPTLVHDGAQYSPFPEQPMTYPQNPHFSAAEVIPHTPAVNSTYMNMHGTFDDPSQYFSSPEQQYYNNQPMHASVMMEHGHMQVPLTSQSGSNEYVFAHHQQHGNSGQHYYQS